MGRTLVLLLCIVALVALPAPAAKAAQGKVVRLTLIDENGSGEDGSARLTDLGDGTTRVELFMLNAPEGAVQPAVIYKGSCTSRDTRPAFPLNAVVAGQSVTVVTAPLAALLDAKHAIAVYQSAAVALSISCGNVPSAAALSTSLSPDQVLTALVDQAAEVLGSIKKREVDASQHAYDLYAALFTAHAAALQGRLAQNADRVTAAQRGVRDGLQQGDWAAAEAAAVKLVTALTAAQGLGSGAAGGTPGGALRQLQDAAEILALEITRQDRPGSQLAYDAYAALWAASRDAIGARNAATQAGLDTSRRAVGAALAAGDLAAAATAADELRARLAAAPGALTGAAAAPAPPPANSLPLTLLAMVALGLVLAAGALLRRRPGRMA